MRFLCQVPSDMEVYYVSSGDRFAAQNCLCGGALPAYMPFSFLVCILSYLALQITHE